MSDDSTPFLRAHSRLYQELAPDEGGVEFLVGWPTDAAVRACLLRLPHAPPLPFYAVCRVAQTHTLRPALFAGVSDAQLEALRDVIRYFGMPRSWEAWVEQEAAARHVGDTAPGRDAAPAPLAPLIDAAVHVVRDCTAHKCGFCAYFSEHEVSDAELWDELTAAARADSDALYSHGRDCPWDLGVYTCDAAAAAGNMAMLRYMHENGGRPWGASTCAAAARGGHLAALRYAHEHGCPWDKYTAAAAAEWGHLAALRYAVERGCPWDAARCARAAATLGHADVVAWIGTQAQAR